MNQPKILSTRHKAIKVAAALALLAGLLLSQAALTPAFAQVTTFNPGIGKGSASACTSILRPTGNVQTFANTLGTGEKGCLRAGVYTTPNLINVTSNGGTLAAYPGERAEVRAAFDMRSVSNYELEGLYIDASYAPLTTEGGRLNTEQTVNLKNSRDVVLDGVELVNRRTDDRSGTCVFGGTSLRARIEFSWVHKCGEIDPSTNHEHGFYVANSTGMLIKDTWISDTADRGIQYYNNVHDAQAVGVVVDSAYYSNTGVVWNGRVEGSVLRNSVVRVGQGKTTINVGGTYAGGLGNRADGNCLSRTPAELRGSNVAESGNIVVANPSITGFKVTNPECYAKLPAGSPFRP